MKYMIVFDGFPVAFEPEKKNIYFRSVGNRKKEEKPSPRKKN